MILIIINLFHLQIGQYRRYALLAHHNLFSTYIIVGERGHMLDRNHSLIATNTPFHMATPACKKYATFQMLPKTSASMIPLSNAIDALPECEMSTLFQRHYPGNMAWAHIIGYAQENNDPSLYHSWTLGRTGLEQQYDTLLQSTSGYIALEQQINKNPKQHILNANPGNHLQLTIDAHLQEKTFEAMHGKPGSAVAIDPENGEILAMVSSPGYDNNTFIHPNKKHSGLLEKSPLTLCLTELFKACTHLHQRLSLLLRYKPLNIRPLHRAPPL